MKENHETETFEVWHRLQRVGWKWEKISSYSIIVTLSKTLSKVCKIVYRSQKSLNNRSVRHSSEVKSSITPSLILPTFNASEVSSRNGPENVQYTRRQHKAIKEGDFCSHSLFPLQNSLSTSKKIMIIQFYTLFNIFTCQPSIHKCIKLLVK